MAPKRKHDTFEERVHMANHACVAWKDPTPSISGTLRRTTDLEPMLACLKVHKEETPLFTKWIKEKSETDGTINYVVHRLKKHKIWEIFQDMWRTQLNHIRKKDKIELILSEIDTNDELQALMQKETKTDTVVLQQRANYTHLVIKRLALKQAACLLRYNIPVLFQHHPSMLLTKVNKKYAMIGDHIYQPWACIGFGRFTFQTNCTRKIIIQTNVVYEEHPALDGDNLMCTKPHKEPAAWFKHIKTINNKPVTFKKYYGGTHPEFEWNQHHFRFKKVQENSHTYTCEGAGCIGRIGTFDVLVSLTQIVTMLLQRGVNETLVRYIIHMLGERYDAKRR